MAWEAMNRDPHTDAVTGQSRSHSTAKDDVKEQVGTIDMIIFSVS